MGHLQILKQQIDKLRSSLPVELLPLPEDLAILEPYRSSIFFMASPEPETAPSDEELAQSITEWNEVRRRCLLSLLPRDLADIQGPDPLELASVFFFVEGYPIASKGQVRFRMTPRRSCLRWEDHSRGHGFGIASSVSIIGPTKLPNPSSHMLDKTP